MSITLHDIVLIENFVCWHIFRTPVKLIVEKNAALQLLVCDFPNWIIFSSNGIVLGVFLLAIANG